jgi:hypothetical protein
MASRITNRSSTFRPYGPPPDAAKAAPLSSDVIREGPNDSIVAAIRPHFAGHGKV